MEHPNWTIALGLRPQAIVQLGCCPRCRYLGFSVETWVASALLDELTWDLPTAGVDIDLFAATRGDKILETVRSWVESGNAPPWPACAVLSPELRC